MDTSFLDNSSSETSVHALEVVFKRTNSIRVCLAN